MRQADWYFDFVSPFAYFALQRLHELPADLQVTCRPVLFAGLLDHWGQKGPAEIAPKRIWTYRWCTWCAAQQGIPFRFPAAHPFNPLSYLRLSIAAGNGVPAIQRIFQALWTTAADPADPAVFEALALSLGVDEAAVAAPEVKSTLRQNTEQAAASGVFGVPTLLVDGELFWGADGFDFAKAFLADASVVTNAEMQRLSRLAVGAGRKAAG